MGAGICLQNIILICKNNSDKNIDLLVSTNVIENSILSNCKSKRLLYELVNIIQLLANHSPSPDIFDESWPRTVSGLGGLRNDYVLFTRQITGLKMYTKTVTNILSTPSSPDIENYLTDNTYTIVIHCNTKILQSNFNQWVFIVVESKTKQEQTTLEIGVYMGFFFWDSTVKQMSNYVQVTREIPLRSYLTQEDFVFKLMLIFTPLVCFMGPAVGVVVHTPSTTLSVKVHHSLLTNC